MPMHRNIILFSALVLTALSAHAAGIRTGTSVQGSTVSPVFTARLLGLQSSITAAENCHAEGKLLNQETNSCALIAAPVSEWQGTALRFRQAPDAAWGNAVNLLGPQGPGCDQAICFPPPPPPIIEPPAVAILPGCTPLASEQRTVACADGAAGNITQQRDDTCTSGPGSFGGWYDVANSCAGVACTPTTENRVVACQPGYSGEKTESRSLQCPVNIWTSWAPASDTCVCTNIVTESDTQACDSGQSGNKTRTRIVACGTPTSWSAWNTISCTAAPAVTYTSYCELGCARCPPVCFVKGSDGSLRTYQGPTVFFQEMGRTIEGDITDRYDFRDQKPTVQIGAPCDVPGSRGGPGHINDRGQCILDRYTR